MNRKDLFFCLSVIIGVFLLRKIPVENLFSSESLIPIPKDVRTLILVPILIAGCYLVAKKFNFLSYGGFRNFNKRNYWMLLLPLLFPGAIFTSGFNFNCQVEPGILFISIFAILLRAIMEETVFRGVIHGYLTKAHPEKSYHRICIYSALFFAFVHISNFQYSEFISVCGQIIYAFYMGLLFAALLIRTNNVWLLGIMHGILNFIGFDCSNLSLIDNNINMNTITGERILQIIGVAIIFSPILLIYFLLLRNCKRKKYEV